MTAEKHGSKDPVLELAGWPRASQSPPRRARYGPASRGAKEEQRTRGSVNSSKPVLETLALGIARPQRCPDGQRESPPPFPFHTRKKIPSNPIVYSDSSVAAELAGLGQPTSRLSLLAGPARRDARDLGAFQWSCKIADDFFLSVRVGRVAMNPSRRRGDRRRVLRLVGTSLQPRWRAIALLCPGMAPCLSATSTSPCLD